jgi:uncharacterized protein (DUF885 family)
MSNHMDTTFRALVEERFRDLVTTFPVHATFLGIHSEDHRFGDASREAMDGFRDRERRHLAALEALDPAELSDEMRFERDLALFNARRSVFDLDVHRVWERRSLAMDEVGDGIFALLARDFAPLPDRLESIASRLEQVPRVLAEYRTRLMPDAVKLWNEIEVESAAEVPGLFAEVVAAGRTTWSEGHPVLRRLERASERASAAVEEYGAWLRQELGRMGNAWPLGRERYDELVDLRQLDGLTTDDILAIGEEQLEVNARGRAEAARAVDPRATEAEVVDRLKSNHPATFDEALAAYRNAMDRARRFIVDHGVATLPPDERLTVIPTPEYLRNVIPFAAYFEPPKFDASPSGLYVVTPSVDGNPRAMREHYYGSISNTSIHEAYPGHHLQLSAAIEHPSLVRLLVDAPEFVEGWAMYCEQMMREEGFDTGPEFMVALYTDAIWRACRIVLDVRLHRGEMTVDEAIDFLVERTGFERPNAQAEVFRYTYTPTYQFSYLLGKVLLMRLREDERKRLGDSFSLRSFHDRLLYAGSLPISFHRRVLAGEGGEVRIPAIPA